MNLRPGSRPLAVTIAVLAASAFATGGASVAPSAAAAEMAASAAAVPAGEYRLDKAHASLVFRLDHLGFSHYTGRFTRFEATLSFDPARPTASRVDVTIDASSLEADNAPPGFLDELRGPHWLDAAKYPTITFHSTRVVARNDGNTDGTLHVTGDFTLHGATRPLTLDARYNGGYAGHSMDPHARVGFSARGELARSAFGIRTGVPAPGTKMGVGDDVTVEIEAEFSGPPLRSGG